VTDHGRYNNPYRHLYGNGWTFLDLPPEPNGQIRYGYYLGGKLSAFRNASNKILLFETERGSDSGGGAAQIGWTPQPSPNWSAEPLPLGSTTLQALYSFRHPKQRMNVAYLDGHVDSILFSPTAMDDKYFDQKY
jgi:prepilin-type processing-associated H-X9-DG protein